MYVPAPFRDDDTARLVDVMQRHDFATLVSHHEGVPVATHLPLAVTVHDGAITIRGHLSRENPQWRTWTHGEALAIFSGPHAYVSPAHYVRRESVPTWNYVAVHAYGTLSTLTGEGAVAALLDELIGLHEPAYRTQWDDLPDAYRRRMIDGLVAFEMQVTRLEGAAKLSQNKSRDEQRRIADALLHADDAAARALGAEMTRRLAGPVAT